MLRTRAPIDVFRNPSRIVTTWFAVASSFVLGGYLLFNRAFAWIHIPGIPVFAGEIVLALALLYLATHQRETLRLARESTLLKLCFLIFIWGLIRLAFDLPLWGIDALRDSAQTNYILMAIAAAVIVRSEPAVVSMLSLGDLEHGSL